jgi:D-sedoheptulose 7-phosphate isomerase
MRPIHSWLAGYVAAHNKAVDSVSLDDIAELVALVKEALAKDRRIFVIGNGGNAATAAHFATDLGKGASDRIGRRFKVMSLTDNTAWVTAIGNDYGYEDVFVRQLENFAEGGDLVLALSVSGRSPNCLKALQWARSNGLRTAAIVGETGNEMAAIADRVVVVASAHYGHVEDVQMEICHMICYAFIDRAEHTE